MPNKRTVAEMRQWALDTIREHQAAIDTEQDPRIRTAKQRALDTFRATVNAADAEWSQEVQRIDEEFGAHMAALAEEFPEEMGSPGDLDFYERLSDQPDVDEPRL